MDALSGKTGVLALGENFKVLNPDGPWNHEGTCMDCAVAAANFLVMGITPCKITDFKSKVAGNGHDLTKSFTSHFDKEKDNLEEATKTRAGEVLGWLMKASPGDVYAVDGGSHAYNFIIGNDCKIYLFDSNQYVFKQIMTLTDFEETGRNGKDDEPSTYDYNYGSPNKKGAVDFFYWGKIHPKWSSILNT